MRRISQKPALPQSFPPLSLIPTLSGLLGGKADDAERRGLPRRRRRLAMTNDACGAMDSRLRGNDERECGGDEKEQRTNNRRAADFAEARDVKEFPAPNSFSIGAGKNFPPRSVGIGASCETSGGWGKRPKGGRLRTWNPPCRLHHVQPIPPNGCQRIFPFVKQTT